MQKIDTISKLLKFIKDLKKSQVTLGFNKGQLIKVDNISVESKLQLPEIHKSILETEYGNVLNPKRTEMKIYL